VLDDFLCFLGTLNILTSYEVVKICVLPKAKQFNLGLSYSICTDLKYVLGYLLLLGLGFFSPPLLAPLLLKLSAKVSPGSIFQNSSICWCHRLAQHTQDTLFPIYFQFQYKHICSIKTSSLLHACDLCLVGAKLLL